MPDLTDDQRLILAAFAAAEGPVNGWDLISKMNPEPKRRWRFFVRSTEYGVWLRRHNYLIAAVILLDDLIDGPMEQTVITDAGRDALATAAKKNLGESR